MRLPLLFTALLTLAPAAAQTGAWECHLAYRDITEVQRAGSVWYALASGNLFCRDTIDNAVFGFDKTRGLTGSDIRHIAYVPAARRLLALYADGNIDLIDARRRVQNLGDYAAWTTTLDKTVSHISVRGQHAYLATSFGIVDVDAARGVVANTFRIGFRVDYTRSDDRYLYAVSYAKGTYRAAWGSNMLDPATWQWADWSYVQDFAPTEAELAHVRDYAPTALRSNQFGTLRWRANRLYTVQGSQGAAGAVQVLDEQTGQWQVFDDSFAPQLTHRYTGLCDIDASPTLPGRVAVAAQSGVMEFQDGQLLRDHTIDNSPLACAATVAPPDPNYATCYGCHYDAAGRLWVLASNQPAGSGSLFTIDPQGQWESHHAPSLTYGPSSRLYKKFGAMSLAYMKAPMTDSRGLLWFVNDSFDTPCLVCYQPQTGGIRVWDAFTNQDGRKLDVMFVHCVAEDPDGYIWCGTDAGPLRLAPAQITDAESTWFEQVKVPRNDGTNLADYLLAGCDIQAICCDGAGRKWMAAAGAGVYLISADCMTQEAHLTAASTPLPSDDVLAIACSPQTGRVYFGTERGMAACASGATEPVEQMTASAVRAYPNPVRPDYQGDVVITGLALNADVKITTAAGALVAQGRSTGGTFRWTARAANGDRVPAGIYCILAATADGAHGVVARVAVVR